MGECCLSLVMIVVIVMAVVIIPMYIAGKLANLR